MHGAFSEERFPSRGHTLNFCANKIMYKLVNILQKDQICKTYNHVELITSICINRDTLCDSTCMCGSIS
jgi:hypothetical protein